MKKRIKLDDKYDFLIMDIMHEKYIGFILRKLVHHDIYTFWHCVSVARQSIRIADCLNLSKDTIHDIGVSAILHDIGKLYIPSSIIQKQGKLTDMEFEYMKMHPIIGADMLYESGEFSYPIIMGVKNHHMNLDGTGYGAKYFTGLGLYERIIRIADSYDAMTDVRSYRNAFNSDKAIAQLNENCGTIYDPKLLNIFISNGIEYKLSKSFA